MKMNSLQILQKTLSAGFLTLGLLTAVPQPQAEAQAIACLNPDPANSHYSYSIEKAFFQDIQKEGSVSVGSVSFDNYYEYTSYMNVLYQTGADAGSPQVNSYKIILPHRSKVIGITTFKDLYLVTLSSYNEYGRVVPMYLILKCFDFNQPPSVQKCFTLDPGIQSAGTYPQHSVSDGTNIFTTGYFVKEDLNILNPKPQDDKHAFVLRYDITTDNFVCKLYTTPKTVTPGYSYNDIPDYDNGMRLTLLKDVLLVTGTANGKSSSDIGSNNLPINSSYVWNVMVKQKDLSPNIHNYFGYTYSGQNINPTEFNGLVGVDLIPYQNTNYISLLTAYRDGAQAKPAVAALDNNLTLLGSSINALEFNSYAYTQKTKTQPHNIHSVIAAKNLYTITGIRSMKDDYEYMPFTLSGVLTIQNNVISPSNLKFNITPNASGCEPSFGFSDNRFNRNIPLWTSPYGSIMPNPGKDLLQMDLLKYQANNKDPRYIYEKYDGTHYCNKSLKVDFEKWKYEKNDVLPGITDLKLKITGYKAETVNYQVSLTSCDVNPNIYSKTINLSGDFAIESIYPNPSADGNFTITFKDQNEQFRIRIINAIGQVISDREVSGRTQQIHIPAAGLYLLEAYNSEGVKSMSRIVVK